jgi:hypothetical protein
MLIPVKALTDARAFAAPFEHFEFYPADSGRSTSHLSSITCPTSIAGFWNGKTSARESSAKATSHFDEQSVSRAVLHLAKLRVLRRNGATR